jgi:hypothetical protein
VCVRVRGACVCVASGIQSGGVSSSIRFNRPFPTVAIFIVVMIWPK